MYLGLCKAWYLVHTHSQIFHFSTAEQHRDEITFCAVCLGTKFDMRFARDMWLGNTDVAPGQMHRFTLDLGKRTCEGEIADRANVEFPTVHPYRHGLVGGRYSYLMASDRKGQYLPYRDVVKVRGSYTHTHTHTHTHTCTRAHTHTHTHTHNEAGLIASIFHALACSLMPKDRADRCGTHMDALGRPCLSLD